MTIQEIYDDEGNVMQWLDVESGAVVNVGSIFLDYVNKKLNPKAAYLSYCLQAERYVMSFEEFCKNPDNIKTYALLKEDKKIREYIRSKEYKNALSYILKLHKSEELMDIKLHLVSCDNNDGFVVQYELSETPMRWLDTPLLDLQKAISNKNIKFSVCNHCEKVFIRNAKNQKYCDDCRELNIPEKKKQNTEKQKLYRNIYGKIYARRKGNIPSNDYGIDNTTESFSEAWKDFLKTNPTYEEQIEWLKDVDYQISRDNLRYY